VHPRKRDFDAGGRSSTNMTVEKNAPERNDIPAFIPPFDHDRPATEECDVAWARQVGIQRWLSWQMLLSKKAKKKKKKKRKENRGLRRREGEGEEFSEGERRGCHGV
jgi:hypothetical protein